MQGPRKAPARAALLGAAALVLSGCGLGHLQDLNFRVDKRLHIVRPPARSMVHLPLTVSWTIKDFAVVAPGSAPASRDAGYFAIFVDRTAIKPGQTMDAVASGDTYCQRSPTCPDQAYLRDHMVFTTTGTSLTLRQIPVLPGVQENVQMHSITVVLMNTAGHRIGESAWELDVRMRRTTL